jgi:actin-related protein
MSINASKLFIFELLFEKFNVKGAYVSMQAVLALYGSSKTTGLVVDSGDGVTHIVPVFKGYSINNAIKRFNLAGRDLTDYFCHILKKSGIDMFSSSEKEIVKDIKEKYCFFKNNKDINQNYSINYKLPDGNFITINEERHKVPEVLFDPKLLGYELDGLGNFVFDCVKSISQELTQLTINLSKPSNSYPSNLGSNKTSGTLCLSSFIVIKLPSGNL